MIEDFLESAARKVISSTFERFACVRVGGFWSFFGIVGHTTKGLRHRLELRRLNTCIHVDFSLYGFFPF